MIAWFASLGGAVAISFVAMLSFIGYSLLVYRYVIEQIMPGISGAAWQTAFVLLLVGAWSWSLFSAMSCNRIGLIVALICTSLPALFTLYDLVFQTPIPYGWPLVQISVWVTLGVCIAAIAALVYQLITSSTAG